MRDDHTGRGPGRGVRSQEDVAVAQRDDPQHPGRSDLPRADHHVQRPAPRARLDEADHHRPSRPRRPVQGDRLQGSGGRHRHDHLQPERRRRADRTGSGHVRRGRRRRDGDVQLPRLDPRLRQSVVPLRPRSQRARVPQHEEHDPQGLRRRVQGHLPGRLRRRVQRRVRGCGTHVRAPPDRRHGRRRAQVGGRLSVGVQELRRRRPERCRRAGLRIARPDDVGADDARRQDRRSGGGARHRHPSLPGPPARREDLDQPDRVDLRVDEGPLVSGQDGRHARRRGVRRGARSRLRRGRRGRRDDQGPVAAHQQGRPVAHDGGLPRHPRPSPPGEDGPVPTRVGVSIRVPSAPTVGRVAADVASGRRSSRSRARRRRCTTGAAARSSGPCR